MIRWTILSTSLLLVLCAFQWKTLRDLKRDLATVRSQLESTDVAGRGEETARVMAWLDAQLRTGQPARVNGLCPESRLDLATVQALVFDVYFERRRKGASELEAREDVLRALATRTFNPGS